MVSQVCYLLLSIFYSSSNNYFIFLFSAFTQDIQIQALPPKVILRENDLVIVCSITNPSQLDSLFYIELSKNASIDFNTVVSVTSNDQIKWADSTIQNRGAIAVGSISTLSTAHLRLTIDKDSVQCPEDFKMYRCKISGLDTLSKIITKASTPIIIDYTGVTKLTSIIMLYLSLCHLILYSSDEIFDTCICAKIV